MPQHPGYQDALSLTVSLCLIYTLCVAGVRAWIRKGSFGTDDVVVAVATMITVGHYATSYAAIAQRLGWPWLEIQKERTVPNLNDAAIAGVVTFIFALYLSKCAMLFFLSRITKTPRQLKIFLVCNVATAVIGVACILLATVGCPSASGYYWAFHDNRTSCPTQSARWQVITGLDVVTEIVLLVLPVYLVWDLQMPFRKKCMIIAAFYLRLPVLGFSIGRNYYALQLRLPQTDPGVESALVVIWLGVELAYALAASTLSALKGFTESFNSDFGLAFTRGKGEGSYGMSNVSGESGKGSAAKDSAASADASRKGSVTPEAMAKGHPAIYVQPSTPLKETTTVEESPLKLRPDTRIKTVTCVTTDAEHRPWRRNSSASSRYSRGGEDMVIVRETAYDVQHDRIPMLPVMQHL